MFISINKIMLLEAVEFLVFFESFCMVSIFVGVAVLLSLSMLVIIFKSIKFSVFLFFVLNKVLKMGFKSFFKILIRLLFCIIFKNFD